jgi:hypothetical protein
MMKMQTDLFERIVYSVGWDPVTLEIDEPDLFEAIHDLVCHLSLF